MSQTPAAASPGGIGATAGTGLQPGLRNLWKTGRGRGRLSAMTGFPCTRGAVQGALSRGSLSLGLGFRADSDSFCGLPFSLQGQHRRAGPHRARCRQENLPENPSALPVWSAEIPVGAGGDCVSSSVFQSFPGRWPGRRQERASGSPGAGMAPLFSCGWATSPAPQTWCVHHRVETRGDPAVADGNRSWWGYR